ncbi:MAG: AraC family transcriptional regulator, partial [Flavobacterium sp.]
MDDPQLSRIGGIAYSCYTKLSRVAENFVPVHVFTYIESGSLLIVDGQKEVVLRKGDFAFYAKNTLAKFTKMPSGENGEYKSLSVRIDEGVLREMAANLTVAASVGPKAGILKLEFDKDL